MLRHLNHERVIMICAGDVIGSLVVLGRSLDRKRYWICECECGRKKEIHASNLGRRTNSCGCREGRHVHDMCGTPTYVSWQKIKSRCNDQNGDRYADYGGRGIRVCDRWAYSFEDFYKDMGDRPSLKHSIDRIDVNGNYEPGNCRWATAAEQSRNNRRNHWLTARGVTKCRHDWAKDLGISEGAIRKRIRKGMSVEDALFAPVDMRYSRRKHGKS